MDAQYGFCLRRLNLELVDGHGYGRVVVFHSD